MSIESIPSSNVGKVVKFFVNKCDLIGRMEVSQSKNMLPVSDLSEDFGLKGNERRGL